MRRSSVQVFIQSCLLALSGIVLTATPCAVAQEVWDPCDCPPQRRFINPNRFRIDPCLPPICPSYSLVDPVPGTDPSRPDIQPQPDTQPGMQPADLSTQDSFSLSSGLGSGQEGFGMDVATIGDFFGGGAIVTGPTWGNVPIVLPTAGGDRRYKLNEHTSPMPSDRVFYTYNVFDDAVVDANGNQIDLNRYLFGFERTFLGGDISFEIRLPFANGADAQQQQDFSTLNKANEFGNISLTTKALLLANRQFAVSTGVGVIVPSAASSVLTTGSTEVTIDNKAYHLQPFFAVQRNFSNRSWITFFTQCDFATQGNTVISMDDGVVIGQGVYNDQHLLFLDLSMGRWLHRNQFGRGRIQGIAGIFELHYTTTLNDTDSVQAGLASNGDTISNPFNRLDVLNSTAGLRFLLNDQTMVTLAGVAPLRTDEDSLFDGEFVLQISRSR